MKIIDYEEIQLLKQSEKSKVLLVREKDGEQLFVQKILKGRHDIYSELLNCPHSFLPKLYEVGMTDHATVIIEEYVEGQSVGNAELSEKQLLRVANELCTVLEFLHGKSIIHRDIKPSNIIFAKDGHIRLIDFDAARIGKDTFEQEQDTRLLGTRGYAPPEQYGFAQTDTRSDIYSLGVTLEQLLGDKAQKPQYRRIIRKCTNLNPDKRYQTAGQVKKAFSCRRRGILYGFAVLILIVCLLGIILYQPMRQIGEKSEATELPVLPVPKNPHWDKETGIALWGNVPDYGDEGKVAYLWKLYRQDTETPSVIPTANMF